ncbi:hypothetical protein RRF57_006435 [Xylaria bambusicola]|uniref:Uncharacterized protein n=1 Tax=Xylaria bambusicola TaxID=326684 RepID=A0AAN7UEB0_9PEZI
MSSFFSVARAQKKRKRENDGAAGRRTARPRPTTKPQAAPKKQVERDEEISSESDDDSQPAENVDGSVSESDEDDKDETAAQKRLRLASEYLVTCTAGG